MNKYYSVTFADAYNSGAYGACTYNASTGACTTGTGTGTGTTSPGGSTTSSGGGLVNTGFIVLVIATIACLLIFAALIVRLWRRPHKLATQSVEAENDDQSRDPSA